MANIRYIVDDVAAAVEFYARHLGFVVRAQPGPGFAILARNDLSLLLSAPGGPGGAGQAMPDGRVPSPGGWNRFQIEVSDLSSTVDRLKEAGVPLRSDIIEGRGGKQILIDDPAGNPVELFEPTAHG